MIRNTNRIRVSVFIWEKFIFGMWRESDKMKANNQKKTKILVNIAS